MRNKLIEWEHENGYKSNYVAQKIGITPTVWSRIKHGKYKPSLMVAERLQKEFGIENVFELLKED